MTSGWTIVLDVGKSLSKATLWDEAGSCKAQRSRPNQGLMSGVSFTLDVAGIEYWLEGILKEFGALGPVGAIIPVAHGAAAALIRNDRLQCAPLDYEWPGVSGNRGAYSRERDSFDVTGSPALPAGLNLGMQLHWLESLRSGDFRSGQIVPWAQYWAWALSGIAASEVTSLGCHTDLWRPYDRRPSDLAVRRGWAERLAPVTAAGTVLGRLRSEWVNRTGLSAHVDVYCGLHDSNAALLGARRHRALQGRDATVLSTGTWFVAMRSPLPSSILKDASQIPVLEETRDCLVNVDVSGTPVPSSRFMGGREIEILAGTEEQNNATGAARSNHAQAAISAIARGEMIRPGLVPGVGPFPHAKRRSVHSLSHDEEATALAQLYAALVADVSLDLIGSRDTLMIDGRFSQSSVFVKALARLRPDTRVLISNDDHGVAHGALHLVNEDYPLSVAPEPVTPLPVDLTDYRARWREAAQRTD